MHDLRDPPDGPLGLRSVLTYGNGRSYGDVCMNSDGVLLDSRSRDKVIAFDTETGVLSAEAGILLSEVLAVCVPAGWFIPVVPGTRWLTVGGAIANDVHGKNHHVSGTFGRHVLRMELLRSDGSVISCGPDHRREWYAATIGGLGLTGTILEAEIQLVPIESRCIDVRTTRFSHVSEFFEQSAAADDQYRYTVAWVDCFARGDRLGRGRLMVGNHAAACAEGSTRPSRNLDAFIQPPFSVVNNWTGRLFNAAYYRQAESEQEVKDYESYFFPLDAISRWNRVYGPKGFYQFQCVVPPEVGQEVTRELLLSLAGSREAPSLAVLKQFGDIESPGLLSFPRPGPTLAVDLPNRGASTSRLLKELERIVNEAGGAIYPAKDACMSPETFRRAFPRWQELEAMRDPAYISDFWSRVTGLKAG